MGKLRRAEIDRCMLRVLHALAAAVAAGRDPAALARLAVDTARDLLAVDAASLYWWDAATAVLRCVAHTDPQRSAPARATRPAEDVAGQSLAQRAPVIVEDYPRWAHGHADPSAVGVRTAAAVPLLAGERALGVLLVHTYCPRHYAPSDLQLLAVLASQVGPTLEVARLDAEAKHRGAEAAALANLACQGAAECDPERVLSLITEAACSLLGADYAAVALTQPNGAVARYGIRGNRSQVWRDPVPAARPSGLTRRVLADGQPVLIEHLGTNTRFPPAEFPLHRSEGGRTVLGLPLRSREELLGALHLGWRTDVTLTAGQRRLAEGLASHAATILASAPARAELAVSEAQYRTLYEAVPCGVLVRSPSGEIVHANAAMAAMVGIPVEQLSGRKSTDLWQVIREDGAPRVAANLNLTEACIVAAYVAVPGPGPGP